MLQGGYANHSVQVRGCVCACLLACLPAESCALPCNVPRNCTAKSRLLYLPINCRLLNLQPVLTIAQLTPLHTSCCKLPHALRSYVESQHEATERNGTHTSAVTALFSSIRLASFLVRSVLLLHVPPADDPQAVSAWDRCVAGSRLAG